MPLRLSPRRFTCLFKRTRPTRTFVTGSQLQRPAKTASAPSHDVSSTDISQTTAEKPKSKKKLEKAYRDSFFPTLHNKHERRGQHNLKKQLFGDDKPHVPAYPYGEARLYKQSNRGLYGGRRIQYGHSVSEKNQIKTRKRWKVNVQRKTLYSEALRKEVKVRVAAGVLRTIDKVGGLDNYIMGGTPARIKELGVTGWMLRYRIAQTPAMQESFRKQRLALGLPEDGIGLIGLENVDGEAGPVQSRISVKPDKSAGVDSYVRKLLRTATLPDTKEVSAV